MPPPIWRDPASWSPLAWGLAATAFLAALDGVVWLARRATLPPCDFECMDQWLVGSWAALLGLVPSAAALAAALYAARGGRPRGLLARALAVVPVLGLAPVGFILLLFLETPSAMLVLLPAALALAYDAAALAAPDGLSMRGVLAQGGTVVFLLLGGIGLFLLTRRSTEGDALFVVAVAVVALVLLASAAWRRLRP